MLLYVGSYTDADRSAGIHLLRLDRRTGRLRSTGSVDAGPNPSFLALHPNGGVLYPVNEIEQGAVGAFAIAGDGALTRLNEASSRGSAPCFVSVDRSGQAVFVANYASGSVALLPIESGGALLPATSVVQHEGLGPHAHCVIADPSNRFVLAADVGADRVFVYRLDPDGPALKHAEGGDAVLDSGAGPRHLAFHPTLPVVFVANELDSTVVTLRFDARLGVLSSLETRSTLPAGWTGTNYPADIHLGPSGRTLYVSNRGHNSLAVITVAESTAALSLEQIVPTEGDWPRSFGLDPTGQWLLVANQKSDSIVVFGRDPESGRLSPAGQRCALPSPACLRFHRPPG